MSVKKTGRKERREVRKEAGVRRETDRGSRLKSK